MARHQNKHKALGKCLDLFKKQRKNYERMLELCEMAQDTLFSLSYDTSFYVMGNNRVYTTEFRYRKLCILINENVISFDFGNKNAISKAIDKVSEKDFKEYIRKVKELYL